MSVRNYSLADHSLSIVAQNGAVGSANYYSAIIGNGDAVDTISVSYANENASFTMSADGSASLSTNYMRNGTITVTVQQTSPINQTLIAIYKKMTQNGVANPANIVLKDGNGNINGSYEKCVITKTADYTAGAEADMRSWTIIFGKGTEN